MSHLVDLVQHWEEFLKEQPGGGKEDFARWLLEKDKADKLIASTAFDYDASVFRGDDPNFNKYHGKQKTSMQGAYLVVRLGQYLHYYAKPLMKRHGLHSLDDFGYLQNVRYFSPITKSKACELMMQEVTTGMDIINRLIKNGLIRETINREDKRQKLLELTEKGNMVIDNILIDFAQLPDTLGNLPENDRDTLLQWMMQLDIYHDEIVKATIKK
jgi:DNA-binding MarR family transcriptional regulator